MPSTVPLTQKQPLPQSSWPVCASTAATETWGGFPLESLIQGLPLMPTTLSYALKYWLWKLHGIEGGDAPTDAPVSEDLLPEAAFEDIFGESTGDLLEDILT